MVWLNGCPADWLTGWLGWCVLNFIVLHYAVHKIFWICLGILCNGAWRPWKRFHRIPHEHKQVISSTQVTFEERTQEAFILLFFLQSFYCVGLTSTSNLFSYCTRWGSHYYEIKMCFQGCLGYTLIFWRSLSDILIEITWMQTWNLIYMKQGKKLFSLMIIMYVGV